MKNQELLMPFTSVSMQQTLIVLSINKKLACNPSIRTKMLNIIDKKEK